MSNTPKITDRIPVLMAKLGLEAVSDLEKGPGWDPNNPKTRLISNGLISDWEDKTVDWTSDRLDKFLNEWNVNREWWRTGEGEVLNENHTHKPNLSDNKEKPLGDLEVYRTIVEGKTEYLLIPRSVLQEKYRLQSIEDMEKDRAVLDALIEFNRELLRRTENPVRQESVQPPKV